MGNYSSGLNHSKNFSNFRGWRKRGETVTTKKKKKKKNNLMELETIFWSVFSYLVLLKLFSFLTVCRCLYLCRPIFTRTKGSCEGKNNYRQGGKRAECSPGLLKWNHHKLTRYFPRGREPTF